jgi:hypothetical protein
MSIIIFVVYLIAIAVAGATTFAIGFVYSMNDLLISGIVCLCLFIVSLIVFHCCFSKNYFTKTQVQTNPGRMFTTNNMNTMKRNKSDTDLELINRESKANEGMDEQGLV